MFEHKHIKFDDVQLKMSGAEGIFKGYASVFGGVDSYGDTMLQGAFNRTLKEHGTPQMFLSHAAFDSFASGSASLPIGKYLLAEEDSRGLYVEGRLTPNLSVANDVKAAMLDGTISGLSIGGHLKKGDYKETDLGREITHWSVLREISIVAMPADSAARVMSFKAEDLGDIETIRDFERCLRDAGGFSKAMAQSLSKKAAVIFGARDADQGANADVRAQLIARLETLAKTLQKI